MSTGLVMEIKNTVIDFDKIDFQKGFYAVVDIRGPYETEEAALVALNAQKMPTN